MKILCLLLIGLGLVVLAASFYANEDWAYGICSNSFGLCDYRMTLGTSVLAFVGLFFTLNEV